MTSVIGPALIIGLLVLAAFMVKWQYFDPALWTERSEKLAREYGITLRPDITDQVARHLRRQAALAAVGTISLTFLMTSGGGRRLLDGSDGGTYGHGYRSTLVALPLFVVAYLLVFTWPAWRKAQARRVTHLIRPTPWQAFTRQEWQLLTLGVLITVAGGAFGLSHGASGAWWAAWFAALAAGAHAWWRAATLVLARPAQASDDVELGWDDVLRHRRVRELTIGAAWLPAGVVVLADWSDSLNLPLFYATAATAVLLSQAFKQGRHLWRKSWGGLGPA